jgi:hypothetical protein
MVHENDVDSPIDVILHTKLLKSELKECTPLTEVGFIHVQSDWNMGADADHGDGGSS